MLYLKNVYMCLDVQRIADREIWNVSCNGKKRGGWEWGGKGGLTGGWDQNEPYIKTSILSLSERRW